MGDMSCLVSVRSGLKYGSVVHYLRPVEHDRSLSHMYRPKGCVRLVYSSTGDRGAGGNRQHDRSMGHGGRLRGNPTGKV